MKYLIEEKDPGVEKPGLAITYSLFASGPDGLGEGAHITWSAEGVVITDVTIFAGRLTHGQAIKWGVLGLLRVGPLRVKRIKSFFSRGRGTNEVV